MTFVKKIKNSIIINIYLLKMKSILIVVIFLVFLISFIYYKFSKPITYDFYDPEEYEKPKFLQEKQDKLMFLLKKFMEIAKKNNIKFMAHAGTLLGVIRHEGIIPWDDDIDFAMSEEDILKLNTLEKEFDKHNLKLILANPKKGLHIAQLHYKDVKGKPHIDFFEFELVEDRYYKYKNKWCENKWPNEYYLKEEFENRKISKFNDVELEIPSYPFKALRRHYGDWEELVSYGGHND